MKLRSRFSRRGGRNTRVINQACQIETLERRTLLATIAGTVFNDLNGNGTQDAGEAGVADWQVFVDLNNNFVRDAGEARVFTDANGNYIIGGFSAGEVDLAQIVKQGWVESDPGPREGLTVTVANVGDALTGKNFAIRQAIVGGRVYQDFNQDGVRQGSEPGLGGVTITIGTASTLTSGSGIWGFADIADGTYTATQSSVSNYVFTVPVSGSQTVEADAGEAHVNYNFGNVPLRNISGTVVNDLNDNVARDAGEPGLAGWTVFVDYNGDTVVDAGEQSAVTGAGGTYTLSGIRPGSYFVRAVPQAGFKLRPAAVVASPSGFGDATGIDFVPSAKGRITGNLWYDINGNGIEDAGEPAQVGWGVFLDTDNDGVKDAGEAQATTDSTGKYLFTNLTPGAYKVRSLIPANWSDQPTNRPTNLYSPNTTGGSVITDKDFGYVPAASVAGFVFDDTDADGVMDAGETGTAGATIFADADSDGVLDAGERTTTSGADGSYKLWSLPAGTYRIDFVPQSGSVKSTGTPDFFDVTLTTGEAVTGRNFGTTVAPGTIAGTVFRDLNSNGAQNAGELGIESVRMFIDTNSNGVFNAGEVSDLTDASGNYSITGLVAGTYRLTIELPSGFTVTAPTTAFTNVVLATAQTVDRDFSIVNLASGTIAGTVFNDANSNGAQNAGELGIQNVRMFIDANSNGVFNAGESTAVTDASGNYSITGLVAGTHRLTIELPAGYQVTAPTTAFTNVTLTTGQSADRDFSIVQPGNSEIRGFVFDDANSSGAFGDDPGDAALPGRQVFIDLNNNGVFNSGVDIATTTDGTGTFNFTGLTAGTYKVYLTLNPGEVQTGTPATLFYTVTLGISQIGDNNNFSILTPGSGSIAGFVYLDGNQNGSFGDPGDTVQPGRQMFIDRNNNGTFQSGTDTGVLTDGTGTFQFTNLPAAQYKVYLVLNPGETATGATPPFYTIDLGRNQNLTGANFSIFDPGSDASIAGFVWLDADANSLFEVPPDSVVTGRQVYLDANDNGTFDAGEEEATTDGTGTFHIVGLAAGTYKVRVTLVGGETPDPAFRTIVLSPHETRTGADFRVVTT